MLVLQIETLFDFLLYIESVVAFLMLLLTIMQLFIDGLHFVLMTTALLSHVAIVVTSNLL